MSQLELIALVVPDYDSAIRFFVDVLQFDLVEDVPSLTTDGRAKRWVVVRPPGAVTGILLAQADGETQRAVVGAQWAGRVGLFLRVENFDEMLETLRTAGIEIEGTVRHESYGRLVVFRDPFGNRWDLLGAKQETEPDAEHGSGRQTDCAFCDILAGRLPATVIAEDAECIAFIDLRQFHDGHVLVIPRAHVADLRSATDHTAVAVMRMLVRVTRAVSERFPGDGLSIWHSAGPGAHQEVPHLHFHVHPRYVGDDVLRVYPTAPELPDRATLEVLGTTLRRALHKEVR